MIDPKRRAALAWGGSAALAGLAAWPSSSLAADLPRLDFGGAARRLAERPMVLMMRHELTVPGVGDPPGFRLEDCSTQRNLSNEGRGRARQTGERMRAAGIALSAVRSSRWCRCLDTARIAFGTVEPWPALDSFFSEPQRQAAQLSQLAEALNSFQGPAPWMLVTHQVNISAFLGVWTAMGEIVAAERVGERWQAVFRI
jgi:broad specificity phosphatase PhoE